MQLRRHSTAKDIELPAERKPDPRLKKPDVRGAFKQAYEGYKAIGKRTAELAGKRSMHKGGR